MLRQSIHKKLFSVYSWLAPVLLSGILFFAGCKDDEAPAVAHETGTVTDIDGNVYATIKIGDTWWMAANLKVKHYRNGLDIRSAQADTSWDTGAGAWCLFDENATSPGLLYNWQAVTDTSGIAPSGWHVATDAEWKQLETTLGMSSSDADGLAWRGSDEADKLRIASPQGWTRYGSVWSTNESGFSALAGACRLPGGTWADPGLFATGFWWTSSAYGNEEGWYRYMDYKKSSIFRSHVDMKYGMSIRCVKN